MSKETIAKRLEEAGVGADRFVDVNDGEKKSTDHTHLPPEDVSGNYGVRATARDNLVIIDVDDYKGLDDKSGLSALMKLPPTLEEKTPHGGTHRFFVVPETDDGRRVAAVFADEFGVKNPKPSWGEVRVANQYVVAAGSQLNGCDKDECDECAKPDGGRYELTADGDRPISTVSAEEFIEVLSKDPNYAPDEGDETEGTDAPVSPVEDEDDVLDYALNESNDEKLQRLWRGDYSDYGGDRSRAESALAYKLAFWLQGDRQAVRRAMDSSDAEKWAERTDDSYRDSILEAVDKCDEYFDPEASRESAPPKPPEPDVSDTDGSSSLTEYWEYVNDCYNQDNGPGRQAAADALEKVTDWMYVIESRKLWVYEADTGYFNPRGESYIRNLLERKLRENYSKQEASEVIERIQARNQTRRSELNARTRDSPLLCVGNGVVNLETGDMTDHSPEYKFTRGLKWDYDPANADPETITDFLDDITAREEDRDTLLDHLAHGLMPGHPYRAFVMMYGPGSNGKTRVGKLFRGFVGEENAASVELQDLTGNSDDFATGGLPGAFINVGDDISVGEIRDTSIIKSLTGDGTIRANEKYEKKYEFENEAAMFFSANEPPRLSERTDAINDRLYPVEMPYRFVDNPDGDMEKQKIPGIAEGLIRDGDAMRGLLVLAVKHAQDVIERRGEYSMPEGPAERREMYEAASDPIKRFAINHLEASDHSSVILKDDAYTVYTEMCEQEGERSASADVFKRKISGLASIDVESTRTRKLSPGSDREQAWRYIGFAETAKQYVPQRLLSRYFSSEGQSDDETDPDPETPEETPTQPSTSVYGATPITDAAETLTGYVTVTAKVATTMSLGDDGCKAILKDESGAMDIVAWEEEPAAWLSDAEGKTIVVHDAEVREYDGKRQLTFVDGLTELETIQAGVGYAPSETPGGSQTGLETQETAADGGESSADSSDDESDTDPSGPDTGESEDTDDKGPQWRAERVVRVLASATRPLAEGTICSRLSSRYDISPEDGKAAIEKALMSGSIVDSGGDKYRVA